MSFQGPHEDRLAIRDRLDAYSDAVFRHDAEAWIDCWTEDAHWKLPTVDVTGKANIKAAWIQAMSGFELAGFFANPGAIMVAGTTAKMTAYTQEVLYPKAGGVIRILGSYDDTLVKQGGVWRFKSRAYTVLRSE
jgi:ketosteroid isomerase-like protein